jgi:DNA-binding SARP family transcriptional activator/predicted ATPase
MYPASDLCVYLLDSPHIEYWGAKPGTAPLDIPRLQTRALLYRLAVHLAPVARDHLCFLFWPDAPDPVARRNLTLLLSHLRRALPAPEVLITGPEHVRLDSARVWSDSAHFAQLCTGPRSGDYLIDLQNAVALYRGPLFTGFAPPHTCPEYELWLNSERQRYERMALDTLATLVERLTARGRAEDAISYARRYLEIDALAEEVHCQLMRLYALAGDRAAACRQFERCVEVLERELGVSPLPETHAVYAAILQGQIAAPPHAIQEPIWTTLAGPPVALAGRQQAWQSLHQHYTQAAEACGGVVLLAGEAGIGKSRLMQEFAAHLPGQVTVLTAASHRAVQSIPYQPLVEALRPALRDQAALVELPASWLSVASLLFPEIRSLDPHVPAPMLLDPEQARGQIFEALCRLLLALSRHAVVLLCLDDLHWADSTTLDWLSFAARYLRRSRLLILGAYRSEEASSLLALRSQLSRLRVLSEVQLAPLDIAAVKQVLAHFYPGDTQLERLAARLHKITGGNPFFLLESVQALIESGLSPPTGAAAGELPISSTVRATIEQRMERLPPIARQVLEAGAVLGPAFDFAVIGQTAGRRDMETVAGLDELVARHFFEEQGPGFRFHHELIQAAVYQSLSYWRRQLLHRRAAEVLEQLHPDLLDPASGQIADHYARGGLPAQAIPCYQRAAEVAERLYATHEAAYYLSTALKLLEALPDRSAHAARELELLIALASALITLRGWSAPEVKEIHLRALALCAQIGTVIQRFQVVWGLEHYYEVGAEFALARQYAEDMLELAHAAGESALVAAACFCLGTVLLQTGHFVEAHSYFQQTIDLHHPHQHHPLAAHLRPDQGMLAACFAAHALWHLGYPEQALAMSNQALAMVGELARPYDQAVALVYAATLHQFRQEHEATYELAHAAARLCEEGGFTYYLAWATILLGWVQVKAGEVEKGILQLRRGMADFDKTGAGVRKPYYLSLLAEALHTVGQVDEALRLLAEALTLTTLRGETWLEAELVRLQGELLLAQGAAAKAVEQHFARALALARHQQAKSAELRVALSLCRLWQKQGRTAQAHTVLAGVYGWFGEGFDTPDLIQAQLLLQALSM